jgi:hypothetical protein
MYTLQGKLDQHATHIPPMVALTMEKGKDVVAAVIRRGSDEL